MVEIGRQPSLVDHGDPIRVGIVGTGFMGTVHARAARHCGARLVGFAGSRPEGARAARDAFGAERVFDSADDLIGSGDVDVVHICTPNNLHAPLALKAIDVGLARDGAWVEVQR